MWSPLLSNHCIKRSPYYHPAMVNFNMNWTSVKRSPCLIRPFFLSPKGDLLIQVWLYFLLLGLGKIFRGKKLAIRYFTLFTLFRYFYHFFRLKSAEEIIIESQKKVTDLENEVHGLKVTVEKKEHAIKALTEEKDDYLTRYV